MSYFNILSETNESTTVTVYMAVEKNVKAVRIRSDKRLTFMEKSYHFRIVKK